MRRPANAGLGRRVLDGLAGAAGLVGGAMLLSGERRRASAPAATRQGYVEFDDTAKAGRGRPGTPPTLEAEQIGHEPLDANAAKVAWVMAGLAVSVIAAVFALLGLLELFHLQLQATRPPLTGEQLAQVQPPRPNLVAHPLVYLHAERARENRVLNSWGWRDSGHTAAHIPIDRAMALTVGHGLDASP